MKRLGLILRRESKNNTRSLSSASSPTPPPPPPPAHREDKIEDEEEEEEEEWEDEEEDTEKDITKWVKKEGEAFIEYADEAVPDFDDDEAILHKVWEDKHAAYKEGYLEGYRGGFKLFSKGDGCCAGRGGCVKASQKRDDGQSSEGCRGCKGCVICGCKGCGGFSTESERNS